jgi:hypothetical protein
MIINRTLATTPVSAIFTATFQTAITTVMFCNITTSTDATIKVYAVASGLNPSPSTQVINNVTVPVGETFVLDTERLILDAGDALWATASVSNTIVATASLMVTG